MVFVNSVREADPRVARAEVRRAACVGAMTRRNQVAWFAGRASLAEKPGSKGWRKLDDS